ncbi:hypothetical protein B0O80DRAFT_462601 [Mortierella sp. GBAus27b]|nr:hypothetical protein B0O80DRAFT_462601 [Mortierella sp. GBAus27b]
MQLGGIGVDTCSSGQLQKALDANKRQTKSSSSLGCPVAAFACLYMSVSPCTLVHACVLHLPVCCCR